MPALQIDFSFLKSWFFPLIVAISSAIFAPSAFAYSTSVPDPEQSVAAPTQIEVTPDHQQIILPNAPDDGQRPAFPNLPVERDLTALPRAVFTTRETLIKAAKSGDVEKLRPIIMRQGVMPLFSLGESHEPIQFLRDSSNDGEGRELLAIMIELLEAPYAKMLGENGEPDIYIWPAYATSDLSALTPDELIDVYKIISHYDLEEMQLYGGWYFFRVGIDANGAWRYFLAGD